LQHIDDGRIKQFLIWRAVALRRSRETVFRDGDYAPRSVRALTGNSIEHAAESGPSLPLAAIVDPMPLALLASRRTAE
jgi:hypothetical protein